jgi:hypothetical protein
MIAKEQVIKSIEDNGLTITLLITEQCNFECRHCFYSCGPSSPKGYMSQDILTEVLDQITAIEHEMEYPNIKINLIGGEPTLNMVSFKAILERVFGWLRNDYISGIEMTTNGWWLHEEATTIQFCQVIADVIPEDYLGLDGGFTVRVSNDKWHDEFRPYNNRNGPRLQFALSDIWDNHVIYGLTNECDVCETEFNSYLEEGDNCPIKGCYGMVCVEEFCHTRYVLPNPEDASIGQDWIYVDKHNSDPGMIIPIGRGESVGSNDKCRTGECHARYGGHLCYKPDGTLQDICCSGSMFPAGTVRDDPFTLLAMAMDFGKQQTSCHGCHEAARGWLEDNAHKYTEGKNEDCSQNS